MTLFTPCWICWCFYIIYIIYNTIFLFFVLKIINLCVQYAILSGGGGGVKTGCSSLYLWGWVLHEADARAVARRLSTLSQHTQLPYSQEVQCHAVYCICFPYFIQITRHNKTSILYIYTNPHQLFKFITKK